MNTPLTQPHSFHATSFATIARLPYAPTVRRYTIPKLVADALKRVPSRTASRRRRIYPTMRAGQDGYVFLRHHRWIGRYYEDVPGQSKRKRTAVVLGMKSQMTKTAARQALRRHIEERGINRIPDPPPLTIGQFGSTRINPSPTFNAIADAWIEKRLPLLKPSAVYADPPAITNHLRPFFGQMHMDRIKTMHVNDWVGQMNAAGLKPKTVHNLWRRFRAIANWWAQQNDEPPRKWYPILPEIPYEPQRWFTLAETARIVDAAKGQYRLLFRLAAYSGLRFGELAGLHVDDVDFSRGVITVRRSVWDGQEVTTKTRRGYRDVWIDSTTVDAIRQHLGTRRAGRIFETRNGTPLRNDSVVGRVLKPICRSLGIEPGGMHAFRHGRISHLQANGAPADFTKNQVGHSSLRTTSGYTHFTEQFQRDLVERLAN